MKSRNRLAAAAGVIAMSAGLVALGAATKGMAGGSREVVKTAEQMQFKEAIPGVSKSVLWGDPSKGSYGAITRFAKGTKNPLHTHPHDIKAVVISGTLVYDSGSGEKRLGPGSFLLEPAGVKHTSGAGDDADCVFFEESNGAFDMKMAK